MQHPHRHNVTILTQTQTLILVWMRLNTVYEEHAILTDPKTILQWLSMQMHNVNGPLMQRMGIEPIFCIYVKVSMLIQY